jgi:hypothetical protein
MILSFYLNGIHESFGFVLKQNELKIQGILKCFSKETYHLPAKSRMVNASKHVKCQIRLMIDWEGFCLNDF